MIASEPPDTTFGWRVRTLVPCTPAIDFMERYGEHLEPDTGSAPGSFSESVPHADRPTVIGIGASAGGLAALRAFFAAVPLDTGMSFVVIMDLDPQRVRNRPALLRAATNMPVTQVTESMPIVPDHVYVVPPGKRLTVTEDTLSVSDFEALPERNGTIDLGFRALATVCGDGGVVLLSGDGDDGSSGIKDVKAAGGLVLVQDPGEAAYDAMPRNAIATGVVDAVLPVRELAARLVALKERPVQLPEHLDAFTEKQVEILATLHRQTLATYAPPSLLIDEHFNVVHRSEHVGRYLQPSGGTPTKEVIQLVRPELRTALRTALLQAFEEGKSTVAWPVTARFDGARRVVYLTVRFVPKRLDDARLALVIFDEDEAASHAVEDRARMLAAALTIAEQRERSRIAKILHDHVQQLLYAGRMVSRRLRLHLEKGEVLEDASESYGHLDEILSEVMETIRALSIDLSPPVVQEENLKVILDWLASRKQELYGLEVKVEAEEECMVPHKEVRVLLVQMIRELLFNVVRHAEVEHATIRLLCEGSDMIIEVEDGGKGFDPETIREMRYGEDGFGLRSVRERLKLVGGKMELETAPGEGTRIQLIIPKNVAPLLRR